MWCTYAYIAPSTRRDDVDFHVSRRYSKQQLHDYVDRMRVRASMRGVRILELTVFDGGQEIWKGTV